MSGRGRGRGRFYKELYGGRGRGGRGGRGGDQGGYTDEDPGPSNGAGGAAKGVQGSVQDLQRALREREGRPYPAYHDVEGAWSFPEFLFVLDRAQSDPYAAPSRCRVQVAAEMAGLPAALWGTRVRRIATCDFLTRAFGAAIASAGADARAQAGGWHGEKGGEMTVDMPGQHVLERTSVVINDQGTVEARFTVALPARGRSILGQWAAQILCQNLPRYVHAGLLHASLDAHALAAHVACVQDTQALRDALPGLGLIAFVGDGAILPRRSGASDAPMPAKEAVPFASPESLAVKVELPNAGRVRGMGVRAGVTLIVGGGFHGKSTLLDALQAGVYNKVLGDGRERVATIASAVKVRAEDGRRVEACDISPFISNLPMGRNTHAFRTDDASGSTSQAAGIQEALELGAAALLLDEDTCATNFMIRDARMQALVAKDKEPITPFIARIRALAAQCTSAVIVMGGSGDYFGVADTVVCMDSFRARDVTAEAHAIDARFGPSPALDDGGGAPYGAVRQRVPVSILPGGPNERVKVHVRQVGLITYGEQQLDLSALAQLAEVSQTRAIAEALLLLRQWISGCNGSAQRWTLAQLLDRLDGAMDEQGLDALTPGVKHGGLARPRRFDIGAALNRLRSLHMEQS
ncbi:hypothetical protein WJX81_003003 [Elliptochloris bilobata]|uniref:ATPase n=1 Tax=Elliptochloris bilobata TaxID=381761 RepID=A0AAW1SCM7_9CHLO